MRNLQTFSLLSLLALAGCAESEGDTGREAAEAASTCSAADSVASGASTKGMRPNGALLQGINLNGIQMNGIQFNGFTLNGLTLNGLTLNGLTFNGRTFNGRAFNGWTLNGWTLNGWTLNGTELQGPVLQGPVLQGVTLNGTRFEGLSVEQLRGAQLEGRLDDGSTLPVFIDDVRSNPDAANDDVVLYRVSFGADRQPLCGVGDDGEARLATVLANTWDNTTGARLDANDRFTFACEGAALYKCVAAGYKPWKSATDADLHQACTRMLRADYCGDGTSFTKDGTLIDMDDTSGIQRFTTMDRSDFGFEAAWGPDGATCIEKTRFPLPSLPQCVRDRMSDHCEGAIGLTNRSATNNACLR